MSDTGSRVLHRSHLLARPRRLVVPPSRYVVRAAPARRRDPGVRLPSASPNRCGGQGRTSQSARIHSASWRTAEVVDDEQVWHEVAAEDLLEAVVGSSLAKYMSAETGEI